MIVSAGSSGFADRRWFQKAPRLAAESITKRFADIAHEIKLRFDSGFGQPDAPRVLRPSKGDFEFTDFTILFDIRTWRLLANAIPSAESQILSSILTLGVLSLKESAAVRHRCRNLGILLITVTADDSPEPEPLTTFHPNAREYLQHDIIWDSTNGYGPVGNDTGADVLGLYRQWRVGSDARSRNVFFDDLLTDWQLQIVEEIPTTEIVKRLRESDYQLLTWDDAIIGWAVTQLACDGNVDSEVLRLAEIAIARQSESEVIEYRGWSSPDDRVSTLKIVRDAVRLAAKAGDDG